MSKEVDGSFREDYDGREDGEEIIREQRTGFFHENTQKSLSKRVTQADDEQL